MNLTLDEIYGCDLGEYLQHQNKTKEMLIKEIEIDIILLSISYKRYTEFNFNYTVEDLIEKAVPVLKLIEKKRAHLIRVKQWN
jgi:hypothetical protein